MASFSVGIPVYNAEEYLEECVASVLNQSVFPCEIILFNDGSTDRSADLCNGLSLDNPLIRVIHSSNLGPLLGRREIVKAAKGDYIVFLDADDKLRRDAIEVCSMIASDCEPDIICFSYSFRDDFREEKKILGLEEGLYTGQKYETEARKVICRGNSNQLCCKAIKASMFDLEDNYSSYIHFKHAEDLFQLLPVVDRAGSLFYVEKPLYFYRRSSQSGTFHFGFSQVEDLEKTAKRLLVYGEKWGLTKEAVQGLIFQYCYLVKILFLDKEVSNQQREVVLEYVSRKISALPNLKKAFSSMGLDWKFFTFLVINKCVFGIRMLLFLERRTSRAS